MRRAPSNVTPVMPGRHGVTVELATSGPWHGLSTSYESEFRHVGCPALVLHGGDDLTTPANNALTACRASGPTGNDDVQQAVAPGLDHYFPVRPGRAAVGAVGLAGSANR